MAGKQSALIAVAIAAIALVVVLSKKKEPTPTNKPASPAGTLGAVTVTQVQRMAMAVAGMRRGARMGTHLAPKVPNQSLSMSVGWTPSTKSGSGANIPWDYRLEYEIYLGGGGLVRSGVMSTLTQVGGNGAAITTPATLDGVPSAGFYDVKIILTALSSDAAGVPVLPYTVLAQGIHPNAFVVSAPVQVSRAVLDAEARAAATGVNNPDTRFFYGMALANHGVINPADSRVIAAGGPAGYVQTRPGTTGASWNDSETIYWPSTGVLLYIPV